MKILVFGSGLMGPAAAFNAMLDPDVTQVVICDRDQKQLEAGLKRLANTKHSHKLDVAQLDLSDQAAAAELTAKFDAVVAALPRAVSVLAIQAALQSRTPLIDLTSPTDSRFSALRQEVEAAGGLIITGCGLEPGLSEIMARHLAEKLDRVDELHIKCGGVPEKPTPPLGYKIVFGGRKLPLRDYDDFMVEEGQLKPVPRYSGVERIHFSGVGECEAWHERFMPWLLELPAFKGLRVGTQKTIRWPGYAAKVTVLKEMGLLSQKPVKVDGVEIVPKKLLDALLYPYVKLEEGEPDIALLRVEVAGEKGGRQVRYKAEMVDRYDEASGFTAMARTTAFTGAIVACMIGRGELQAHGLLTPEQVITGPLFSRLVEALASVNIRFEIL